MRNDYPRYYWDPPYKAYQSYGGNDLTQYRFPLTFSMHFTTQQLGGIVHDDCPPSFRVDAIRESRYKPWTVTFPWGSIQFYGLEETVRRKITDYLYDLVDARHAASI